MSSVVLGPYTDHGLRIAFNYTNCTTYEERKIMSIKHENNTYPSVMIVTPAYHIASTMLLNVGGSLPLSAK